MAALTIGLSLRECLTAVRVIQDYLELGFPPIFSFNSITDSSDTYQTSGIVLCYKIIGVDVVGNLKRRTILPLISQRMTVLKH